MRWKLKKLWCFQNLQQNFQTQRSVYAVNTMSVETDDGLQEVRGLYDRNGDLYTPTFLKHVCDIQENLILYIPLGKTVDSSETCT